MKKNYELTEEEESILEKNFVWLFGSGRSGTTWLATQLLTHKTNVINESRIGRHLGYLFGSPNNLQSEFELERQRKDYFFSIESKNIWEFYLRKLILNRIFSQFQEIHKVTILKEPSGNDIGFSIIAEIFPNSKIIMLLRDGRDILDSQIDAATYGVRKGGWLEKTGHVKSLSPENRLPFIKHRAYYWVRVMEKMIKTYENHSPDLRLKIRYEDLLINTIPEVQKIYDFLEIPIEKDELDKLVDKSSFEKIPSNKKGKGKIARSAKPGSWKVNFNDEERKVMERIMGLTLKKLRY